MSHVQLPMEERFLCPDNWETGLMLNGRRRLLLTARALPQKAKGHVLLAEGLGEFSQKFAELARDFNRHGLAFHVFDRQGQGLSGRNTQNFFKIHCDDYRGDVDDIERYAMQEIPRDGTPVILLAHSTGGLLSIPALHKDSARPARERLFSGAVLTEPLLGFGGKMMKGREPVLALLPLFPESVRKAFIPGNPQTWARRDDPRSPHKPNAYATDPARAAVHDYWQTRCQSLRVASATIGWAQQMSKAMMAVRRPGYIEAIEHPVTVCVGDMQLYVDDTSIYNAAHRLQRGHIQHHPSGKHELLMERDEIRSQIINEVVRMALKP